MKRAILLPNSSCTTTTAPSSRPGCLVCPACESGELQPQQQAHGLAARCAFCECLFSGAVRKVLAQITALPEALGKHACEECHHPEMRVLPDGVFHCPACGSEVLPINAPYPSTQSRTKEGVPSTHKLPGEGVEEGEIER